MRALREILSTLLLALLIFVLLRVTIETREVQLSSMEPSFYEGQYIVINKVVYYFHPPQRGDVVVLHPPNNPGLVYIKRVIALPDDTIRIEEGEVYLNGSKSPLKEPYISRDTSGHLPQQVVPPGSYFVMGDNRDVSSDSRNWGAITRDKIIGKAWLCYWPPTKWGLAPNYSLSVER